ncbi:MAG: thioredoxin family protein [Tepidisphaerales bacterium]
MIRLMFVLAAACSLAALAVSQLSASQPAPTAAIGQPAPAWTLEDQDGKTHSLADFKGKIVVLEWFNNECPFVVKFYREGHMNRLAAQYMEKGVVWLAVNSTNWHNNEHNRKIAQEWNIQRPILNDSKGDVGRAYGARTTPHMYIINPEGVLVYAGAIDSNPSSNTADISGATNFVAKALDELLAGKPVSQPETRPYGCSVKYAK